VVIRNRDKSVPKWNSVGLKVGHGDCEARNWEWIHRSKLEARIVAKAKGLHAHQRKNYANKGYVTLLWPCHLHQKVSQGKRRIMETQIFHHAKMQSSKNPLKQTKILQDIITLVPNLKFEHKPKYHLSKILI
jgi:hypothetical protein